MTYNTTAARTALRAGDLRLAESLLPQLAGSDAEVSCLRCEILFIRGFMHAARKLALDLSAKISTDGTELPRLTFIAGASSWELGDEIEGTELLKTALTQARKANDDALQARIRLFLLERVSATEEPYRASLPVCAETVRAVRKSGDKNVLAEAHVVFARLEARNGALQVAHRHLNRADRILADVSNRWLSASVRLTSRTRKN